MITFDSISHVNIDDYDEVWAIVRSMKKPIKGMKQVTELSPSPSLFKETRTMMKNGAWNEQAFDEFYKPRFMHQIKNDPAARQKLLELCELDKSGERIALVCFCADERACHRSLVKKVLSRMGVQVESAKKAVEQGELF